MTTKRSPRPITLLHRSCLLRHRSASSDKSPSAFRVCTAAAPTFFATATTCFLRHSPPHRESRKLENIFADRSMQSSNSSTDDQKDYLVRKLEQSDKEKGFIELLRQLTVCDSVSDKDFNNRFEELRSYGNDHLICVIEDKKTGKIVATGSLFVEKKFIRNCGKVGHVEDVVVDSNARGLQLGKKIVGFLADHARAMGCYKVILDCSTENQSFYEKCGFKQKEIQMVKYFT